MDFRRLCVYLIMLNVFVLSGCDVIYRMLDKQGAEEKELIGVIIPFEENPTIKEIQILLKLYGYHIGKVDGILGMRTRDAIEKFQKDTGLIPSRFVDKETWKNMCVFKNNKLIVDHEINIVLIQKILLVAGYNIGTADGKIGRKTQQAIESFQDSQGLNADGKVGYKTLTAFSRYLKE